jgi:hypothetical protein
VTRWGLGTVQAEKVQLEQLLVKACVTAAFENVVAAARLEEAAQVLILAHTGMVTCCWVVGVSFMP